MKLTTGPKNHRSEPTGLLNRIRYLQRVIAYCPPGRPLAPHAAHLLDEIPGDLWVAAHFLSQR